MTPSIFDVFTKPLKDVHRPFTDILNGEFGGSVGYKQKLGTPGTGKGTSSAPGKGTGGTGAGTTRTYTGKDPTRPSKAIPFGSGTPSVPTKPKPGAKPPPRPYGTRRK